jgi:formiminotetrahydrofolate cyclodeaminase
MRERAAADAAGRPTTVVSPMRKVLAHVIQRGDSAVATGVLRTDRADHRSQARRLAAHRVVIWRAALPVKPSCHGSCGGGPRSWLRLAVLSSDSVDSMTGDDIDPTETPLSEWLDRLAQAHGAPGGGAACAVMTAISAALLGMVAAYTADNPEARLAAQRLGSRRRAAVTAAEKDGIWSAAFGAALAMDDGPEREGVVRTASVDAIASTLTVGRLAGSLVNEVRLLASIGNRHVEADLLVAVEALRAALEGANLTARANLELLARHRKPDDGLDEQVAAFERGTHGLAEKRAELDRVATDQRSE